MRFAKKESGIDFYYAIAEKNPSDLNMILVSN